MELTSGRLAIEYSCCRHCLMWLFMALSMFASSILILLLRLVRDIEIVYWHTVAGWCTMDDTHSVVRAALSMMGHFWWLIIAKLAVLLELSLHMLVFGAILHLTYVHDFDWRRSLAEKRRYLTAAVFGVSSLVAAIFMHVFLRLALPFILYTNVLGCAFLVLDSMPPGNWWEIWAPCSTMFCWSP